MAMVFDGKMPMIVMYKEKVVGDPLYVLAFLKELVLTFSSGET